MPTSNDSRTQILISYLKNIQIKDADLVKSPGDAWQLIVQQTNYEVLFNDLEANGMIPTAVELSECNNTRDERQGQNTWFMLFRYAYFPLIKKLLTQGIIPTAEALAQIAQQGPDKGTNGWYWLSNSDESSAYFYELLNHGIVPNASMLDQSIKQGKHIGKYSWYWLSSSDKRIECFLALLKHGIVPTATMLAQFPQVQDDDANTNCWYWLSCSDKRIECFLELLKHGIAPTAAILAQSTKLGRNSWYWLSSSPKRIECFMALLKRGIVPTAPMLAQLSQDKQAEGINGWYWLSSSDERSACFLELLKRGIVPTAAMLAQSPKQKENNKKDSWYWLTLTDKRREIFHRLYQLDVLPSLSTFFLLHKKKLSKEYKRAKAIDRWMKQENITENLARLMTRSAAHLKYVNQVFLLIFLSSFNSDILFYMASYLFPNWCDTKTLKEIFKNENNMLYFSRQLVTPRLYNYSRKIVIYHRERAQSVLETMKASISIDSDNSQKVDKVDIDHSLYKLLASQWVMFKNPGKTPYQPVIKKHHEPITSKSIKDDFEKKLRESTHDLHLIKQSIKRIR